MTVTKALFKFQLPNGFAYEIHALREGKISAGFTYTTALSGISDFVHNKERVLDFLMGDRHD